MWSHSVGLEVGVKSEECVKWEESDKCVKSSSTLRREGGVINKPSSTKFNCLKQEYEMVERKHLSKVL